MYLVDTNVVSEFRKDESGRADARVAAWAESIPTKSLFVSIFTVCELEIGIQSMERRDRLQGSILRQWLTTGVLIAFAGRILGADVEIAVRCAALQVPDKRPELDAWIAATALVHGLTVVTRNVADFEPMGVAVFNPWTYEG